MARRLLTHSASGLVGAILGAAATFAVLQLGLLNPPAEPPKIDVEAARTGVVEELRKACTGTELRGVLVRSATKSDDDKLVVVATIDQDSQKALLETRVRTILAENPEWQKAFPNNPPEVRVTVYALNGKFLPEIRELLGNRFRIDDVITDARGNLRVRGAALGDAARAKEVREKVAKDVAGFLARQPLPEGGVPGVVVEEKEFTVADPLKPIKDRLAGDGKLPGAMLTKLSYDASGTLQARGILGAEAQRAPVTELTSGELKKAALLRTASEGGPPPFVLTARVVDPLVVRQAIQARFADSKVALMQHTRLLEVKVKPPEGDKLLIDWQALCIHAGEQQALKNELGPLFTKACQEVLDDAECAGGELKLTAPAKRAKMIVSDIQKEVNKVAALEGIEIDDVVFDRNGKRVIKISLATPEQEKEVVARAEKLASVQELDRTDLSRDGGSEEEQEPKLEESSCQGEEEAEGPARAKKVKEVVEEVRKSFADDPESRYIRFDGFAKDPEVENGYRVFGVSVGARAASGIKDQREKVTAALKSALQNSLGKKGITILLEDGTFPVLVNPANEWQAKDCVKGSLLEDVVFIDASYDKDGTFKVQALFNKAGQKPELEKLVKKPANPLVLLPEKGPFAGKGDSKANLVAIDLPLGWRGTLQAALAKVGGEHQTLCRSTRIDKVVWNTEGEGNQQVVIGSITFDRDFKGPDDEPTRTRIRSALNGQFDIIFNAVSAKLRAAGLAEKPRAAASGSKVVPSPIHVLRRMLMDKPASEEAKINQGKLLGGVFADAAFDDKGILELRGVVIGEEQKKLAAKIAATIVEAETPAGVEAKDLFVFAPEDLPREIRKRFAKKAGDEGTRFRRTRIDQAFFRYVPAKSGDPRPQLHLEGVSLASRGDEARLREELLTEANGFLTSKNVVLEGTVPRKNPLEAADLVTGGALVFEPAFLHTLHLLAEKTPALDGVVFTDAAYDDAGVLKLEVKAPTPAGQQKLIDDLLTNKTLPALVQSKGSRAVARDSLLNLKVVKDWNGMLAELQTRLAANPEKADPAFSRSRIDRAYFTVDRDTWKPSLMFKGVRIYATTEKPTLDTLKKKLSDEEKDLIPGLAFDVNVEGIKQHENPAPAVHNSLDARKLLEKGVLLLGFRYDGKGNLVPRVRFLVSKEQRQDLVDKIHARAKDIVRADRTIEFPEPLEKDQWSGWIKTWQDRLGKTSDPAVKQTRLDGVSFLYVGSVLSVNPTGTCLDPQPDSKAKTERIAPAIEKVVSPELGPELARDGHTLKVTITDKDLVYRKDAIPWMQKQLVAASLRGVLIRGATYAPNGQLTINVVVNSDEQKTAVERVLRKTLQESPEALNNVLPGADRKLDSRWILEATIRGRASRSSSRLREERIGIFQVRAVAPPSDDPWEADVKAIRASFRSTDDPDLVSRTRIDDASFGYVAGKPVLTWKGICIQVTNDPDEKATKTKLLDRLRALATERWRTDYGLFDVSIAGLPVKMNPTRSWQRKVEERPDNEGILFEDAWYSPEGKLQVRLLLASKEQRKIAEGLLSRTTIDPDILSRERSPGAPEIQAHYFEPKSLRGHLQRELHAAGDSIARRFRVGLMYFRYDDVPAGPDEPPTKPLERTQVLLRVGGVLLRPRSGISGVDETTTIRTNLQKGIDRSAASLPTLSAGKLVIRPRVTSVDNPTEGLQSFVADNPKLDGVGISDAYFDRDGNLAFAGVWISPERHRAELDRVARGYLKPRSPELIEFHDLALPLEPLPSNEILEQMREWTADNLDEVWLDRFHFDRKGVLSLKGFSPKRESDEDLVKTRLGHYLDAHPKFNGGASLRWLMPPVGVRSTVALPRPRSDGLFHFVAFRAAPPPPEGPNVTLLKRDSILAKLKARVQVPTAEGKAKQKTRWDGVMLRRGVYEKSGKFGVRGWADSAEQQSRLEDYAEDLKNEKEFADSLAKGLDARGLRVMPLEPMLCRIRLVMPAYPEFDGLTLDSAAHDVDDRLVLRVMEVGRARLETAAQTLRDQIRAHERWRNRVPMTRERPDGLRFEIITTEVRQPGAAPALVNKAINDVRLALVEPKIALAPEDKALDLAARKGHLDTALREVTSALLHDTKDSTGWYLRALHNLLKDDLVAATRDLRRMQLLEEDRDSGRVQRAERLRRTEALQGPFRRKLDLLRKRVVEDLRIGAPALTIAGADS